jgi:hypothetical protein
MEAYRSLLISAAEVTAEQVRAIAPGAVAEGAAP